MFKKQTYRFLSIIALFAICLCTVQNTFSNAEQIKTTKKEQKKENKEVSELSVLEAMVPSMGFNVSADLFFVFEVLYSFNANTIENTTFCEDLLISYWINLFSSAIVVNAP